jgi:hypothetical protein
VKCRSLDSAHSPICDALEIESHIHPSNTRPFLTQLCLETDGTQFLAVIIQRSERRPHSAGHANIRDGSKTGPSSAEQFERLIAHRNRKAYTISEWKGKCVTMRGERLRKFTQRSERQVTDKRPRAVSRRVPHSCDSGDCCSLEEKQNQVALAPLYFRFSRIADNLRTTEEGSKGVLGS